jgi:hypothetical protein
MCGSAGTAGMPDVRSYRVCFPFEVVCRNQPLEMRFESGPDFSHLEMRAARGPFPGMRFARIFALSFLGSSSVVLFLDPNSDSRNGVCFAISRQASEIIAPKALHSYSTFLNFCPDASFEGERCMEHIVHPIVHSSVHMRILKESETEEVAPAATINLGGTKHRIGLERPHFCTRFRAQSNSWGRSSPTAR